MTARRLIVKIGLADVDDAGLLVLRKRGGRTFILPGGKPEPGESDVDALLRELDEEIGCSADDLVRVGSFRAPAADMDDADVEVRLFVGRLVGTPTPRSEIEEQARIPLDGPSPVPIASSLETLIVPELRRMRAPS